VAVRAGEGLNGSDRVTIVIPNGAIKNQWLQATVKTDNTGLEDADVFYFGNTIGETGNSSTDAIVNVSDMTGVRNNTTRSADLGNEYDFDRNGKVNVFDLITMHYNRTDSTTALNLINVPQNAPTSAPLMGVAALPDAETIPATAPTTTLSVSSSEVQSVDQPKETVIADPVSRNSLQARRNTLFASFRSSSWSLLGRLTRATQYRHVKLIETSDADDTIDQIGQLPEVLKDS